MKQRKLLFLLTAVFALSVPLSACDGGATSSLSQQETEKHAMAQHFVMGIERAAYSSVKSYEGEVLKENYSNGVYTTINSEHNLVVLSSTKYTNQNTERTTYTVVDVKSGEQIYQTSVENDYVNSGRRDTVSIDVRTYYPLIEVTRKTWVEDIAASSGWLEDVSYSYYYAKENSPQFAYGLETPLEVEQLNSISIFTNPEDDKVTWVGEDMEVLRTFNSNQMNGYGDLPDFKASYNDYLYAWAFTQETRVIEVYNREGVCCMQYTYPSDANAQLVEPVVLNNGNILVQELKLAEDDATDYAFKVPVEKNGVAVEAKVYATSKIVDYKTGDVKVLDVDYVVMNLEAAYAHEVGYGDFALTLQDGYENQAVIAKIVNHSLAPTEYVVLDNDANVVYTVQNEWLKANALVGAEAYSQMALINDKYYIAANVANRNGGGMEIWLFDYDGNKVAFIPQAASYRLLTEKYIVTSNGIYDYTNTLVYDFETNDLFTSNLVEAEPFVSEDELFCVCDNRESGKRELYKFDGKDFVKQEMETMELDVTSYAGGLYSALPQGNKITVTFNSDDLLEIEEQDTMTWTLYNEDGEALLKLQVDNMYDMYDTPLNLYDCSDVALYETVIDGKPYVYVIQ